MSYRLSFREKGLNIAWKIISLPNVYRYARRFDKKSLFAFRLSGPDQVMIEPTNYCNLRCIMCGRTYFPQPLGYMELELYKNLINQIRVPITIPHFGWGEPLLHPDIVEMIRYSAGKKMRPQIVTNGMPLTAEMSRALLHAGLTYLWISLDGARKETFEKIRPGANFETVVRNIEDFVRLRGELGKGHVAVVIGTVPMRSNFRELPELARMAVRMGIDRFEVQRFEVASQTAGECHISLIAREEDPYTPELRGELAAIFSELDEISRSTGFPITRPLEAGDLLYRLPRRCPMPYTYPVVTWDGYVMPCFCFSDPREINMGNLKEKPFNIIWNGKPYREFREALLSSSPHPRCKSCKIFQGISNLWDDYREVP